MILNNFKDIIIKPIVTEKTLLGQESGRYYFYVRVNATKGQIKTAFEQIFGIKPLNINTLKLKGKNKTDWKKRLPIKKSDRKKAIITVPKGKKIDLLTVKTK
jgi:large subunit ribosomal protein L23